jgi:uncharacterized membrane protein
MVWLRNIAIFALMALAPLAIHAAIASSRWTLLVVAIPAVQLFILGGAAAVRDPRRLKWLLPLAALFLGLILWAEHRGLSLNAMAGIPHAVAYTSLLLGFGYTLLPGQEAILTRIVVAVRGPLPAELIVHTRRVTFAWCCFFAVQLLVSAVLYMSTPLETWSFFINVMNLPLVVLMFVVEGLYRAYRFRDFPMDSASDIVRVLGKTMDRRMRQADPA